MKNIFILPTDKPSRLAFDIDDEFYILSEEPVFFKHQDEVENRNIYITSDEEIKEDDWVLFTFNDITEIVKVAAINNNAFESKKGFGYGLEYCKKIILTTDQKLIADGVQSIDDKFLEWFVKNPTCENVEIKLVEFEVDMELGDECIEHGSYYKIIIPQEEPKQETIEEAALKSYPDDWDERERLAFIEGAEWQTQRMYSEADRIMKFLDTEKELKLSDAKTIERIKWYFETYFEQFKKK
jgi:hypothetical protein